MENSVKQIVKEYLEVFPNEKEKIYPLEQFLYNNCGPINDWNNTKGHISGSAFIYAQKDNKFLALYHRDLKMYLYPGGHATSKESNPLETAIRETMEETGLTEFLVQAPTLNNNIPFDIDIHKIDYNPKINLPAHLHFDFRYLFIIPEICSITIDREEASSYQWITLDQMQNYDYGQITRKLQRLIDNYNDK